MPTERRLDCTDAGRGGALVSGAVAWVMEYNWGDLSVGETEGAKYEVIEGWEPA
jgi:hypothetical protein